MNKQNVLFQGNEHSDAPEELILTGGLEEVKQIRDTFKDLFPHKDKLYKVCLDLELYSVPEESDWRHDASYVILYIQGDTPTPDDIYVYQYHQSKYDAADQIETGSISLNELEEFLTKKQ